MTEAISRPDIQSPESPRLARTGLLDNFASRDMPGRPREIRDCVTKIHAKVGAGPAGS